MYTSQVVAIDERSNPEELFGEAEEHIAQCLALYKAVSRLSGEHRTVIELMLKDLSAEQIAAQLGAELETVEKVRRQALYHLRVALGVKIKS